MLRIFSKSYRAKTVQYYSKRELTGLVVGVPKETLDGEYRVAMTPAHVVKLKKSGAVMKIENNAGLLSGFTDAMYKTAGAEIVSADDAWKAQVVAKVLSNSIFPSIHYLSSL